MSRLTPAVSALAMQTMRMAFEELSETITPADARELRANSTLEHVWRAAVEIETQLAAKQSLYNMRCLVPLFKGLEHYAKVVNVLCYGTSYLPWIWAPITLVLRVASEYKEAFEQLMKGYSRIADCLTRFEILSDSFLTNPDFQQTIAVFYADILQFHKHAYIFVRRSGWRLLFLTSWGRFQRRFDNIIDDLNRHGQLIDIEANARNISEARQMRQDIQIWREESLELVQRDEEKHAAEQYQLIMSWLRFDDSEQLSLFESILEEGSKFSGTCTWIMTQSKVRVWLQQRPDTPFVWLQGNPGVGKTVISGQIINFIQLADARVIRHFCTHSYMTSTRYEYIVRSLLLQLLRTNGELLAYVYQEYVLGLRWPSIANLERLLQLIALNLAEKPGEVQYLWIVLDGLEECEVTKQPRLLNLLNHITTKSSAQEGTVCKVLVSSRYSQILFKHLRKRHIVSLSDEKEQLNKAIRSYTIQRLQSSAEQLRQLELEPKEVEEIVSTIAQNADGMFLYARLVLDNLTTNLFYTRNELKDSIQQLPQTLSDFYNKILTQILAQLDPRSVDRIKTILSWIAFARRPLKRFELLSAVSFSRGDPNVDRPAPLHLLDICSPLVEERRDTTLVFIHASIKEFLQTSLLDINEAQAHSEHGIASITCLISGLQVFGAASDEQSRLIRLIKGVHGLHVYATEFWTEYLLSEAEAKGGLDTSSRLFHLAIELANRLEMEPALAPPLDRDNAADAHDDRLQFFQAHEVLQKHIRDAMKGRSRKRLQLELLQWHKENTRASPTLDGISRMLQCYEDSIETSLNEDFHPGVSAEELETFKTQYRTSAYTCRLRSCPRATIGFETGALRYEHEMVHAGEFRCPNPVCQYPPFASARALMAHMSNYHTAVPERGTSIPAPPEPFLHPDLPQGRNDRESPAQRIQIDEVSVISGSQDASEHVSSESRSLTAVQLASSDSATRVEPYSESYLKVTQEPDPQEQEPLFNDVASLVSDDFDIRSQASSTRSHIEIFAVRQFTEFLAQLPAMRHLHDDVLSKIGKDRFVENYRRILKVYYRNLQQEARERVEKEVIRILQRRLNRSNIAIGIMNYIHSADEATQADLDQHGQQSHDSAYLEDWLSKLDPEASNNNTDDEEKERGRDTSREEPGWHDDRHAEESDKDWDSDLEDNLETGFPHIDHVKLFLQRGLPFRTLVLDIRLLPLPVSLREIVESVPKASINLSSADDSSPLNRLKGFMEDYTGLKWDWWPLAPRVHYLQPQQQRLEWKFCGRRFHKSISTKDAVAIQELLSQMPDHPSHCHCCQDSAQRITWKSLTLEHISSWPKYFLRERSPQQSSRQSKARERYTPPTTTSAGPLTSTSSQGTTQAPSTTNINVTQIQGQGATAPSNPSLFSAKWVLFGVQGFRWSLELEHVEIHRLVTDLRFFQGLKETHSRHRGWFKMCLSPFRFQFCRFVKFGKFDANRVLSRGEDLPDDPAYAHDYEYDPRPAKNPPIEPTDFAICLSACASPCIRPLFNPWHDCIRLPAKSNKLRRIPKKKSLFNVNSDDTEIIAWGLEADYAMSFAILTVYHLVPIFGAFGFWIYWLLIHPGDWQNASVPILTILALFAVFWIPFGKQFGR